MVPIQEDRVRLLLIVGVVSMFFSLATGQENRTSQQKHLIVAPLNGSRSVSLEAVNIERGVEYPSVVKLKGSVQIKTPVCLPVGQQGSLVCDGQMVVRAEEAEFDENTGEIQAHGDVRVTPLQHEGTR